jgi:hypothetical protein
MSHHRRRLAVASLAALAIVYPLGVAAIPAFADCSQAERNAGECRSIDGSASDSQVTIRVSTSTPGSSGSSGDSTPASGGGSSSTSPETTTTPPPPRIRRGPPPAPRNPTLGSSNCEVVIAGMCRGTSPPRNQPATSVPQPPLPGTSIPATPPTPPRSISELGQFVPERPGLTSEPGDWSMPRLPTNVIARARTHQQSGELAGWPIEVRFIPHRYHWSFGDGNQKTFQEPGRTWAALGLRQFQPTPTSHVFQRPGSYQLSVRVEYRAEFRFVGESWQRLSGTVSSTSPTSRLRVLTVSPLLLGD